MEMNRKQFANEYLRWLREYTWSLYANLKVSADTNWIRRNDMLDTWVANLRREEGAEDFHWVSVAETRFMKTRPEFHVWAGGLLSRPEHWASQWKKLGGKAIIARFNPEQTKQFAGLHWKPWMTTTHWKSNPSFPLNQVLVLRKKAQEIIPETLSSAWMTSMKPQALGVCDMNSRNLEK